MTIARWQLKTDRATLPPGSPPCWRRTTWRLRLSGGIWLTTATDELGFRGFLGLATLLLSRIE